MKELAVTFFLVKTDRRHSCHKCSGRFHQGQKAVSDRETLYHLSCYADITYEGTHEIGEKLRAYE